MSTFEKFVPLSEFEPGSELPYVQWEVALPEYVPTERIGINLNAINRFARLSGFERLTIANQSFETDDSVPEVNGVSESGAATASLRATATKTELVKSELKESKALSLIYYDYGWAQGTLGINMEGIGKVISSSRTPNALRSPKPWSANLNLALKQGFRKVAAETLVTNPPAKALIYPAGAMAFGIVFNQLTGLPIGSESMISAYLSAQFVAIPLTATQSGLSPFQRRWSLLPNVQIDRALAVHGLAKVTRFVKPLEA